MKVPSLKVIISVCTLTVTGAVMLALTTLGHAGHDHDHSGHDHGKASPPQSSSHPASSIAINDSRRSELGIEIAEVPTRKIGDGSVEVSALPKASVFRQGEKNYVFALPEGSDDRFEKWEVTLGASDDFFLEIKTGVFPGDRIAIAGVGSIRQLEESAEELAQETEEGEEAEPTEVHAKANPETDDSADTSPKTTPPGACPFNRQSPCPHYEPSAFSRFGPNIHAMVRQRGFIEAWHFDFPKLQNDEFGHFVPPCYEVYRDW